MGDVLLRLHRRLGTGAWRVVRISPCGLSVWAGAARWPLGVLWGVCAPTLIKKSGAKRPRGRLVLACTLFFQSGASAGLPARQP